MKQQLVLPVLLVLYCVLTLTAFAQQKQAAEAETLRINTALVTLSVGVTDKRGQSLTNLQRADFAIYEDGQLQELDFFGAEDQPISLGLVLDRSQSMNEGGKLANAVEAALAFLRAGNPQNEAFCLAFNETAGLLADYTSDYPKIGAGLSRLWGEGGTALYDAILAGLDRLATAKHRRRALIVITDGRDEHSQHKLSELIQRIQQNDAQIYTIGFYSTVEAEAYREEKPFVTLMDGTRVDNPRLVFKTLATETGAETYFPRNAAELSNTIARIAASLRRQYTLAYYPTKQEHNDHYRRLEVKVKNVGKQQIKTRQGYRLSEPFDPATAAANSNPETTRPKPAETTVFTLTPRAPAEVPVPPLYRESFDQPSSPWPQTEKSYVKKGKYYVHGEAVIPLPPFQYKDFELTVTAALLGEVPPLNTNATELGVVGLSFRVNPHGYYELSVAPLPGRRLGLFTLSKVADDRKTILQRSDKEPVIGLSNQIKVRCRGPQIELFINGLLVATLKDEVHQAGLISLLFNGRGATFDDLTIKQLD